MNQEDVYKRDKRDKAALTVGMIVGSIVTALATMATAFPPLVAAALVSLSAFIVLTIYAEGAGWFDDIEGARD